MCQRNRNSCARRLGPRVGEERHHVHLHVPEVVALVAARRDALGGDAVLARLGRRLRQLEQVPAHRLLVGQRTIDIALGSADDLDVARRPEALEPSLLVVDQTDEPVVHDAVERAGAPSRQLVDVVDDHVAVVRRRVPRRVVGEVLDEAQRLALAHRRGDLDAALVRADLDGDQRIELRLDVMPHGARDRHAAVGALEAERHLVVAVGVQPRPQHAVTERPRATGVVHRARLVVVVGDERGDGVATLGLPVEQPRPHHHLGVAALHRDVVAQRRHVRPRRATPTAPSAPAPACRGACATPDRARACRGAGRVGARTTRGRRRPTRGARRRRTG